MVPDHLSLPENPIPAPVVKNRELNRCWVPAFTSLLEELLSFAFRFDSWNSKTKCWRPSGASCSNTCCQKKGKTWNCTLRITSVTCESAWTVCCVKSRNWAVKNVPQASWWRSSSASKDLLSSSSWWHFAFLVHLGQLLLDLWHVPSGSATFFCLTGKFFALVMLLLLVKKLLILRWFNAGLQTVIWQSLVAVPASECFLF